MSTSTILAIRVHRYGGPEQLQIRGAAGGVGSFAVQFARWKGAHVIGTTSPANRDFVRSLGAETVIDYTSTPLEQVVHDIDLVLDTVGGETHERPWNVLKRGGTLISILTVSHNFDRQGSEEKSRESRAAR